MASPAQAEEVPTTTVAGVQLAADADQETRSIVAADPQAVQTASTLCGSGYKLLWAERLPDTRRFGTLYMYYKGGLGPDDWACSIFDNNTVGAKHMKLKLCENKVNGRCDVDEGTFSQYAGPVRMNNCASTTAVMWSDGVPIIDAARGSFCN